MVTLRLFALGDSLTEGVADVWSNDLLTPFPGYLARALRAGGTDVVAGSAAWRGADANDGATRQAAQACAFRPDVAVLWLGLNDVLRLGFDAAAVGEELTGTARRLRAGGAALLTATMPLPDDVLALPGWSVRRLSARVQALNAAVETLAAESGSLHLDVGRTVERVGRARMLGPDGIHFTAAGHHAVAVDYLELLCRAGIASGQAPPEPPSVTLSRRDRATWYVTRGTGYAVRRAVLRAEETPAISPPDQERQGLAN
ncbi:GDSL-type esterase/lipase family protein [Serinibacter arcticus]|uniref:GDSL-type esterase/lipase family protein n=1 Tax=Serinibacter arcticus TaxID=1655435 RepID=UPI00130501AD|nr:GDSL-type esterase/lipase family protein [Serinibacter arcticus]